MLTALSSARRPDGLVPERMVALGSVRTMSSPTASRRCHSLPVSRCAPLPPVMRRARTLLGGVLAAALWSSGAAAGAIWDGTSAGAEAQPGAKGSAYGYVTAGPTCPVERPGENCTRPLRATVDARDSRGATVGSTRSGRTGRYSLRLPPGHYTIVVVTGGAWPSCPHTPVVVQAARATLADVSCDTGIR